MSVQIVKRKYNEVYSNDDTNWLLGNVGDWQEIVIDIDSEIKFKATKQNPLEIDYIENAFILLNGESWGQYGFDDGMIIDFQYDLSLDSNSDGNIDITSTIVNQYTIEKVLNEKMIVVQNIQGNDFELMPTNFGTSKASNVFIQSLKPIEGIKVSYGHITNTDADSKNLNSLIDKTKTSFSFPNIVSFPQGQYQKMNPIGFQSGMSIYSCEVRKVEGFSSDSDFLGEFFIPSSSFRLVPQNAGPGEDDDRDMGAIARISNSLSPSSLYVSNPNPVRVPMTFTGEPATISQSGCFIFNASSDYQQDILLDFDFRILDTNEQSDIDNFSVVLLRFSGGNNLTFAEKTYLQSWSNAREFLGKKNSVYKIQSLNINQGDSYAIAIEYEHNSGGAYFIDVQIESGGRLKLSNINKVFKSEGKQFFQVKIKYMISTLFENIADFDNLQIPPFLAGQESLTDNFDIQLYPVWNNPNLLIKNDLKQTRRLGNTGWFNENFNELRNNFKVESVTYFDPEGNSIQSLDYGNITKIKAVISGVKNLNSNTRCGFGFCWVPTDEDDYKKKQTPFYENVFVQSGDLNSGFVLNNLYSQTYLGAGIDNASIDCNNVKFTTSGNKIIFETNFIPNNKFFSLFDSKEENDRNYIIWISVADSKLRRNFSDRVSLIVDVNSLEKNIPPLGPYPYIKNMFIEHPNNENSIGVDNLKAIVQDDILARMPFKIKNDRSNIFQKMSFGIEAYNESLSSTFELQRYEVDLSQYPIDSDGVQQFSFDKIIGFKLSENNSKNWVKILRDNKSDNLDFNGYIAYYGFKIRWEDWIENSGAPDVFFDSNKENNGFNNDWIGYLRTKGWVINFFTEINSILNGEMVEYRNKWNFDFNDYDENTDIQTTFAYFRHSDDTFLNIGTDPETLKPLGVILKNEITRIEISYELLGSAIWDEQNTYSVTTIEIDRGAGQLEMRQLSSIIDSETDNPLKPPEGFTRLKKELDSTRKILKTTCLVDPDLLNDAIRYRITGRVGCGKENGGDEFETRLYESRYELTYE